MNTKPILQRDGDFEGTRDAAGKKIMDNIVQQSGGNVLELPHN